MPDPLRRRWFSKETTFAKALYIAAAKAARMRDLKAHVVTAEGKHRALALWDHSRDWDPGD